MRSRNNRGRQVFGKIEQQLTIYIYIYMCPFQLCKVALEGMKMELVGLPPGETPLEVVDELRDTKELMQSNSGMAHSGFVNRTESHRTPNGRSPM